MGWSASVATLFVGCLAAQWSLSAALDDTNEYDKTRMNTTRRLRGDLSSSHRHYAGQISRDDTTNIANQLSPGLASELEGLNQIQQPTHQDEIFVCRQMTLDFAKAANGRGMWGGEFVRGDWLHRYGVTIDAKGHDGKNNVHPMIFDSAHVESNGFDNNLAFGLGSPNFDCEGFGVGNGGKVGKAGENCEALGNLLIPTSRPGKKSSIPKGGVLVFEFQKHTKVENIGLLNLKSSDQITVIRNDGRRETINLFSVGQNGYQKVNLDMKNVHKLQVSLGAFSAVTELDLCIAAN